MNLRKVLHTNQNDFSDHIANFVKSAILACYLRYDPETEQLLRENLVSKVISVQQMFEKTEKKSRGNLWTKKRKAAIMSMAQITGILQRMADQKPKKKKKKVRVKYHLEKLLQVFLRNVTLTTIVSKGRFNKLKYNFSQ